MSEIIISYNKDQKNTARKLVSHLESKGYSCWLDPRDVEPGTDKIEAFKNAVEKAKLVILIFSTLADKSDDIIIQYDLAFDNDIPIIPFVVSDVEITVSMQHFLNTHDWINAHDATFDEAVSNLIDLIENDEETVIEKSSPKQKKTQQSSQLTQKQKNIAIAVISVIILIIVGIILFSDNKSDNVITDSEKSMDELIVGKWSLIDYSDNMSRTPQEIADLEQTIAGLKQTFSLIFNEDNTFERAGFQPQTEFGYWDIDEQKSLLLLSAKDNPTKGTDQLQIAKITEDNLTLIVAEQIDGNQQVETKLTLQRKK
jgi:hypothetical protein